MVESDALGTTTELWRPTGPEELDLVRESGWCSWPPRLPDQPIFYPVLNEEYAIMIARDWNVPSSGVGYVTRFHVDAEFLTRYPVRRVGGESILELGARRGVGRVQPPHRRPDRGRTRVPLTSPRAGARVR
ncbi:hypothetical protein BDK92_3501 [Micromonospora pisi]|uniref:ADP-ribosylation/crystallin J1 n=1 Tax=Micromonospora pisi TaxID=589240 RepID=A0A495JJQ9_9ACTN|nr:hypothetical protein BDK92_3501 [Micromonospora pisi]